MELTVGRVVKAHGISGEVVVEIRTDDPAARFARGNTLRAKDSRGGGERSFVVDAVEHLVRGIVDNPDDVRVDMVTSRRGRTVEVHVHPDDLGKVIGRGGRTATALRTLVAGIGGRGIRVDVVDTDQ